MAKTKLELVLENLISENIDEAEALLHEFIVDKAKGIHRQLQESEDSLLEDDELTKEIADDQEEIKKEEYFGDRDLAEEDDEEEGSEGEGEESDIPGEEEAEVDADLDGGEAPEGEELSIEDKVEDLEAELERLKAEFEQLMGGSDEEGAEGDVDMPAGDEGEEAPVDMEDEPAVGDEEETDEGLDLGEDFDKLDEVFDSLDEAVQLEPVKVEMKDGKEIGATGAAVSQNVKSPIPQRKVNDRAFKGEAIEIKSDEHKGYERETAPTTKELKVGKNQQKKADEKLSGVSVTMKNAEVGASGKGVTQNNKSPIGSSGARTGAE